MGMHSSGALALIRDARRIDPPHRPLILAGGSQAVYQPDLLFIGDSSELKTAARHPVGPDVAVTGEEFVLLSLIEAVLSVRASGESMRSAFFRAKDAGALDGIPGLIYPRGERDGVVEELIDTGMQRLVGDLDE